MANAIRVQTIDLPSGTSRPPHSFELPPLHASDPVVGMAFPGGCAIDPSGRTAAAAFTVITNKQGADGIHTFGLVLAWDVVTGKELFRHVSTDGQMSAVAFDPAGRLFAAGGTSSGGRVIGWNLATKAEDFSLRAHTRPVMTLAFGPTGRLATGGADGQVKLWDADAKREVLTIDTFPREVGHLAFTPESHLVAATGFDLLALMMANGPPTDWVPAEVRVCRAGK